MVLLDPPECSIKVTHIDGNQALVCSVTANPEDVTFVWRKRVENYTIELRPKFQDGLSSYLVPDNNYHVLRTYICYTNNSVGDSSPCEFDVPGEFEGKVNYVLSRGICRQRVVVESSRCRYNSANCGFDYFNFHLFGCHLHRHRTALQKERIQHQM